MVGTPTVNKVTSQGKAVGGVILGGALSKGVIGLLPQSKYTKLGFAVLSLVGAASIKGSGEGAKLAKNALVGMGAVQGMEAIQEMAAPASQKVVDAIDNAQLKDFTSRTLGLGSALAYPADLAPITFFPEQPALGSSVIDPRLPEGV